MAYQQRVESLGMILRQSILKGKYQESNYFQFLLYIMARSNMLFSSTHLMQMFTCLRSCVLLFLLHNTSIFKSLVSLQIVVLLWHSRF